MEAKAGRLRVMNQPPKLWIVAERPVRLPNALVAAESLRGRFPGGIHFVCDESAAWDNVQWQLYARYFDNVYTFPRVKSSRGLRDLPRLYRQTLNRKTAVADLPIDPDTDVLLCFAGVMGLSTLVATVHRPVYKVLSISSSSYERLTRTPNRRQFRFTTSGWLQNRLVEPLAGLELPFVVEEHASGRGRASLYEYRPLVRSYVDARVDRLAALADAQIALEELAREPAAAVYAAAHAGRRGDRALLRTIERRKCCFSERRFFSFRISRLKFISTISIVVSTTSGSIIQVAIWFTVRIPSKRTKQSA